MEIKIILSHVSLLFVALIMSVTLTACGDDDDDLSFTEHDGTLYGEWVEVGPRYYCDYYDFRSDGTGYHGQWDVDLEWVNDEEEIKWYTVDDKYIYIDGRKYEYFCDGSVLEFRGKTYYPL